MEPNSFQASPDASILNISPREYPGPKLLHHVVPEPSPRDLPALSFWSPTDGSTNLDYSDLHRLSDRLATRIAFQLSLSSRSVGNQRVVPVLLPQSPELYVSLLAILKAGAAFCAISTDAPVERIRFILEDVSATCMLSSHALSSAALEDMVDLLLVDIQSIASPEPEELAPGADDAPSQDAEGGLAYVMYTSGSTGTPKGVGVSHRAACQSLLAHDKHVPQFSRFLQFAAPTFDVSVFEIFFTWFRGCTVAGCRREELLNDLPRMMRQLEVDACELTPTVAGSLLRSRRSVPGLKLLLTIGEMLSEAVVGEFGGDETKESMLWAMYGPTEAAIHCTLATSMRSSSAVGNIGVPLETVSCFIIRPAASSSWGYDVVVRGEDGELALGGFQLAEGYLNRAEQTAAAFIDSPYGRIYRTGDKARILEDETLECLGRLSAGQVKLRGQRIELGEVEQVALRTPRCHGAVALVSDSALILFCAVDGESDDVMESSILETCQKWLPSYMLPGEILLTASFPRLASGKVDRKALQAEFESSRRDFLSKPDRSARASPTEPLSLLGDFAGGHVSPQSTLAAIGIDSLRAIRLASYLRDNGYSASASAILRARTAADLCRELQKEGRTSHPAEQESLDLAPAALPSTADNTLLKPLWHSIKAILPTTRLQASMVAQTLRGGDLYVNSVDLLFSDDFSASQVLDAITMLVSRTEILRTGFVVSDGTILQVVFDTPPQDPAIVVNELSRRLSFESDSDFLAPLVFQIEKATSPSKPPGVRVLLEIHHALYDGWSMDIILQDLSTILRRGELPERPQFRELVAFSERHLSADRERAMAFWSQHLLNWQKPPAPRLVGRHVDGGERLKTCTELGHDVFRSCQLSHGVHVYFQAALALLWSKVLGTEDVVIGTVASGRALPVPNLEGMIGPCISSPPMRTKLTEMKTVGDLANSIAHTGRDLMEHSILSLAEIVAACHLPPGDDVYDVLFVYQESLYSHARESSTVREVSHLDRLETGILVEIEPCKDLYKCHITYQSDRYPTEFIRAFASAYRSVLVDILRAEPQALSQLKPTFSEDCLSVWNAKPELLQDEASLPDLFERTVAARHDALALSILESYDDGQPVTSQLTYGELDRLSNQIAHCITEHGVQKGQLVMIAMQKSAQLYSAILGSLKAGCGYLPVLPSTPIKRVQDVFDQSGARLCLVDGSFCVPEADAAVLRTLNLEATSLAAYPTHGVPGAGADPSAIAYVIYTSGTTGTPKGIAVSHRNIVSNLDTLSRIYPSRENSRMLQSCSQAFDVSVFEMFFAWKTGMCLCAGENDVLFYDLERAIRDFKVTHLSLTPTVASIVSPDNVPSVEFLVTAGEPMTSAVQRSWGERLFQGYGPAETTNICSVKRMHRSDHVNHLGWTLENTSAIVMERGSTNVAPIGAVGELCFGGDQVALGYLGMTELTDERFLDHHVYGRLYRSGDLGRMLADGSLVILGRIDGQVKLRGQRIEPDEVNKTATQSGFADACVSFVAKLASSPAEQLVAYYVPSLVEGGDGSTTHQDLTAAMRARLPPYMMPSLMVPTPQIPRTKNGKVDTESLVSRAQRLTTPEAEEFSTATVQQTGESEMSGLDRQVADVVARVLACPASSLSQWTPLTTRGLDSLTAISLSRQLTRQFNTSFTVSSILAAPCIAGLVRVLGQSPEAAQAKSFFCLPVLPDSLAGSIRQSFHARGQAIQAILPCTPLQEAMLSSQREGAYLNHVLLKMTAPGAIQIEQLWNTLFARHEILRTCFVPTHDRDFAFVQVVLEEFATPFHEVHTGTGDLGDAVASQKSAMLERDASHEPPVAVGRIVAEDQEYILLICHHAMYDGAATEILLEEFEMLAKAQDLEQAVAYGPFLNHTRTLPGDVETYWRRILDGAGPRRAIATGQGGSPHTQHGRIALPLSDIEDAVKARGQTLLSACQGAWASTLSLVHGTPEVCFGHVASGRSAAVEGVERLVAPCFNTVPTASNLSTFSRNLDLAEAFGKRAAEVLEYQFTPTRMIQKLVGRPGRRLFDSVLLLQPPRRVLDAKVWRMVEDVGDMDVPIVCELTPNRAADTLELSLHTDPVVSTTAAAAIAGCFDLALENMIRFPMSRLLGADDLGNDARLAMSQIPLVTFDDEAGDDHSDGGPWDPTSSRIREVLSSMSGFAREMVLPSTSIFRLGLDSINAVQIAARLREMGIDLTASDVMQNPTCDLMAARAREKGPQPGGKTGGNAADGAAPGISCAAGSDDVEAVTHCTPFQCATMSAFLSSSGRQYLNYVCLDLGREVDAERAMQSWTRVVEHQQILRTAILPANDARIPFAMVRRSKPPLDLIESQDHPLNVEKWKLDSTHRVLSSPRLPPWRAVFVRRTRSVSLHVMMHHALYDAQSLEFVLDDFARALDSSPPSARAPIEEAVRFIHAQTDTCATGSRTFWESLAGDAVVNTFPVLTPLREDHPGQAVEVLASGMAVAVVREKCRAAGVSVQAILLASWVRVLASYLGEPSVVTGVVLSGRTAPETLNAAFPCINTLPLVARDRSSNRQLVQAIMDLSAKLLEHQFSAPADIQRALGRPGAQLYDTILVYQRLNGSPVRRRPWTVSGDEGHAGYKLSLEIEHDGDELRLGLTFRQDAVPREQARLILSQFDETMQGLLSSPDGRREDLWAQRPEIFSILPPECPLLEGQGDCVHEVVALAASKRPSSVALEFVDDVVGGRTASRRYTFERLSDLSDRLARFLLDNLGHPASSIIALDFDKCPEAYFSTFGVLKAGHAFLALDPAAPRDRKRFIVEDSGAVCVLTDAMARVDYASAVPILVVSEAALAAQPAPDPAAASLGETNPQSPCYCLYTSGTTGTPKGCLISHANVVQALRAFSHLFAGRWTDESRWLQFASLHFDVSVLEQFWSWSVGVTVVGARRDVILNDLAGFIGAAAISHIDLTPSLARLLRPEDVPSLWDGVFITGGEQLRQEILDVWGPRRVIHNAYGPTEATIGVTMYARVPRNGRPSNIGRQFPNVGSYVFCPGTETPVLRGGVGELCVTGPLVGLGYLNREQLTAERFPRLGDFGERAYRTGDLVRVLHDGCFDFVGRLDDQVKLRGQRLEIGEINHTIMTGVAGLKDVATLVVATGREREGKEALVSFVATAGHRKSSARNLLRIEVAKTDEAAEICSRTREACRRKLPGYMVPTHILLVPYIPLSVNNKADFGTLRRLFESLSHEELSRLLGASAGGRRAPEEVVARLARVVADFFGVPAASVAAESSLLELGMDSITAVPLAAALRRSGLASASPGLLLQNPRIRDSALALSDESLHSHRLSQERLAAQNVAACEHRYLSTATERLSVQRDDIEYIAPCSPLQEAMLSSSLSSDEAGRYFHSFALEAKPGVSLARLQESWSRVVAELPILRTCFLDTPGGFIQVALRRREPRWHPVAQEPHGTELRELYDAWVEENRTAVASPLSFALTTGAGRQGLTVFMFHGLYDGIGLDLILQHVARQYHGGPSPRSQASFLAALLHGPLWDHSHSRDYWVRHFSGWSPEPLRPAEGSGSPESHSIEARVDSAGLLRARATHNVTMQATLLAVWTAALAPLYSRGATTGVVLSGRSSLHEGDADAVGPLFNTLPLFVPRQEAATWASLLQRCHSHLAATHSFAHTPLKDIQKWVSGGGRIVDALFVFQVEGDSEEQKRLWTLREDEGAADHPLAMEVTDAGGGELRLRLAAQGRFFDEAALAAIMSAFRSAVLSMGSSDSPPGCWRALPPGEDAPPRTTSAPASPSPSLGRSDEATKLRDELSDMTGLPASQVSGSSSLHSLGLDSVDAVRLSSRLKRLGLLLPPSALMQGPDLATAARHMRPTGDAAGPAAAAGKQLEKLQSEIWACLVDGGHDMTGASRVLPATPLQETMVSAMVESGFRLYFNHDILQLPPDADLERLKAAWHTVIDRLDVLRTVFVPLGSPRLDIAFCQVVTKRRPVHISVSHAGEGVDLLGYCEAATQRAADAGPSAPCLLQLELVDSPSGKHLVFSIAHALYDGWSLALVLRDVERAYRGHSILSAACPVDFLSGLQAPSPAAAGFWSRYLHGARPTRVSRWDDLDGTAARTSRSEAASNVKAADVVGAAKKHSLGIQAIGQACWAAVLGTLAEALDVTFGVVLSGRDADGTENLAFPTMNTVAHRCVLHGTVETFLRYVEDNSREARAHQSFPLRRSLGFTSDPSAGLGSLFVVQKRLEDEASMLSRSSGGVADVEYPVCVELELRGEAVMWTVALRTAGAGAGDADIIVHYLDRSLAYLLTQELDAPLLAFEGDKVSICGLPWVTPLPVGRCDRAAAAAARVDAQQDWSRAEALIREILAQVAGVEEASITKATTIYHLGLDSISAIRVSTILKRRGLNIGSRRILRADSITEMAQVQDVSEERADSRAAGAVAADKHGETLSRAGVRADEVEAVLPILPFQLYTLAVSQATGNRVFFPRFRFRVGWRCDPDLMYAAWSELTRRDVMLRTVFAPEGASGGKMVQIILKASAESVKTSSGTEQGGSRPRPLVEFAVDTTTDTETELSLRIHHALYDAISLPRLLSAILASYRDGGSAAGDRSTAAWRSFAGMHADAEIQAQRRAFWSHHLRGAREVVRLGADCSGRTLAEERASHLERGAVADTDGVRGVCAREGVSLQAAFYAAFAKAVSSDGGRLDPVVFGVYLANRSLSPDLGLDHPTLNIVPLCVRDVESRSHVELARQIHRDLLEIGSGGAATVDLWEIREWTGLRIQTSVNFIASGLEGDGVAREYVMLEVPPHVRAQDEAARWIPEELTRGWDLQDNVDVEVSVTEGRMDVGVFGPRRRLRQGEAGGVVRRVATEMGRFS